MKKIYLLLLMSCLCFAGFAQTAISYAFSRSTGTYTSIAGTGTLFTGINCDDCGSGGIPINFSFSFCGNSFTQVAVCSNGWLSLANYVSSNYPAAYSNIPIGSSGYGFFFPQWRDGYSGGSNCYYQTTGSSGSRVFTFEWTNWNICCGTGYNINVQVKLFEGSNIVQFCYGTNACGNTDFGIGIANSQSDYQNLPSSAATSCITSLPYGGNTGLPANGSILQWAPPCSGTPTAGSVAASATTSCSSFSSILTLSGQSNLSGITTKWQSSTTSPTSGFVDIPGATATTYTANMSSPGTVYYRNNVTCSNSGVSAATTAVTLAYNAPPSTIAATATCTGQTTSLLSSPTGGTWSSSASGVASVNSLGSVSALTPGTATITYTLPTTCSTSTVVTVNQSPAVNTVTGGGPYCAGGTGVHIGLNGSTPGVNYQLYSGSLISTTGGTGSALDFGSFTAAGTYNVVAATAFCTTDMTGTATVVMNPMPSAIGGTFAVCAGQSATLTNTVSGGTWTTGNPGVASVIASAGVVNGISVGTATISYAITGGCFRTQTVTINPTPQPITGATSICVGATTSLSSTTGGGVWSSSSLSTATVTSLGVVSGAAAGIATINYSLATGCFTSTPVQVNPLPTVYNIVGGGPYCAGASGVHVGLNYSEPGVSYKLYRGAVLVPPAVPGSSSGLDFGLMSAIGTYTASAVNTTTGCANDMAGSTTIAVNPLPNTFTTSGGGNICPGGTGVAVTLSGSESGVSYQLYNGSTLVGLPMAGGSGSLNFGLQSGPGIYTVVATNTGTGCTRNMPGAAIVAISALPTVYTLTGGGAYCLGGSGQPIVLVGSDGGTSYQLYKDFVATGAPLGGTGTTLSFGLQTNAGSYSVIATNTGSTCTNNMDGNPVITINPLPNVYTVTGGGGYCAGGPGVRVGLNFSDPGFHYQLYHGGPVGPSVAGSSSGIDFGLQTSAGAYTVIGTNNVTGCSGNMSGLAVVTINSQPFAFDVSGSGNYCPGTSGVDVMLSGSASGLMYQLYNGATAVGAPMAGSGSALDFGPHTAGVYTVTGINTGTGCMGNMSGSATIMVSAGPTAYPLIAAGSSFCEGGAGIQMSLSTSDDNTNYQLFRGTTAVSPLMAGSAGLPVDFGFQTISGVYTVKGTSTVSGCTGNMSGSVPVTINPLPNSYTVTGGGAYCTGGNGVRVGLSGSNVGINYQLYNGGPIGPAMAGTGIALDFGFQMGGGTYTVMATNAVTSCAKIMVGSVNITVNSLPDTHTVTGGGDYCAGTGGSDVSLDWSDGGIRYQLYQGATSVGGAVSGTNSPLDLGMHSGAGTYTVIGFNPSTGCSIKMTDSTVISINPLPAAYTVTGGGNYCSTGSGVPVGLSSSATGVTYQLYYLGSSTGDPVDGTGSSIDFGMQAGAGGYTVVATDNSTSCMKTMSGTATVAVTDPPPVFTVTGGGNYCVGGTGIAIGLSGSTSGITYRLSRSGAPLGGTVAGTGGSFSFGPQTLPGVYTIIASPGGVCETPMSGSPAIGVNSLPTMYTITGGGNYCAEGTGVHIGLSNSSTGIKYQLMSSGSHIGGPITGTGSSLDFGQQTATGSYSVVGTDTITGCSSNMTGSGSVVVAMAPLPRAYDVFGGGSYCTGGTGVSVRLDGSGTNVNYQLYRGGTTVGSSIPGTGTLLDFGLQTTAGTYTIIGTDASTTCSKVMLDTAIVTINPILTPSVNITAAPSLSVKMGTNVTLTAAATNAGTPSYQWILNAVMIPGATNSTYTSSNFVNGDSVVCEVTSSNPCGGITRAKGVVMSVSGGTTGVAQASSQGGDIALIPNPNKGIFTIKGTLGTTADQEVSVTLTDMVGHVVYSSSLVAHNGVINQQIKVNGSLANGMYLLSLHSATENKVFHMVIEQ